ncbi:MAG: hypothetical protein HC862_22795 [Scytonema sp. RU_4_4]|nr:hypothetical protein [Scytonema sp. RU_4_4]NJR74073.1 hypothetical protein [Scytonema sp. CRU_2_7]
MTELLTHIKNASRELWQVFGQYESWNSDSTKCEDIKSRLSHFNESHSADPKHIDDTIKALLRGLYLIKSGAEWDEPAVGQNSIDKPNSTHRARGVQWRLVVVWSGFEIVTKTLLLKRETGGLGPDEFNKFTQKCGLNSYNFLPSPNKELKNLSRWLDESQEGKQVLDFLSVSKGDAYIIQHWIINRQPISNWVDAVRLAKALRNATAHGALSASKVNQWGLQQPLFTLSNNLGEIVVASMGKLVSQESYVD